MGRENFEYNNYIFWGQVENLFCQKCHVIKVGLKKKKKPK